MKKPVFLRFTILLTVAAAFFWLKWKQDEPRRNSLIALQTLSDALSTGNRHQLLSALIIPQAVQGQTAAQQAEFLSKALANEVSPEGLAVLKRGGQFGSLTNLFPAEASQWAQKAGVQPEDCLAFKLDRNDFRAEVVLARVFNPASPDPLFKIVRCNDVNRLAGILLP